MGYLTNDDLYDILNNVSISPIEKLEVDISHYSFDSGIDEYNTFLKSAKMFAELNVSKTFLLIHDKTNELLAYMTLSADSIKLTHEEKEVHHMQKVPYASIPAVKVGKLAVNAELSESVRRKGYGSFMLEMARAFAANVNDTIMACRFITVDADIEYDPNTPDFYRKNGYVENLSNKRRNPKHTISMRKDIYVD